MATNKHALVRYKVLDRCFRNPGKRYFVEDLINECNEVLAQIDSSSDGISRRQIFDDILFMESEEGWSIDLEKAREGKKVFYRYSDLSFSINNMPLNDVEVQQLKSAVNILSQFKGMPQFEWMHELLPKLQQGAQLDHVQRTIIEFDSNQYLKGIEHLGFLYNAIAYKKVLCISYHPYDSDSAFDVTLHPYYLKQYNNRWFLFGYNPQTMKYDWNLALDRIMNITEVATKYQKNDGIDWTDYFEDIIGVTKPENGRIEKVLIQIMGKTAKYIETKPIHGSQKCKWLNARTLEVSLEVMINYELERMLLSYADTCRIIKPVDLKRRINERLRAALEMSNS